MLPEIIDEAAQRFADDPAFEAADGWKLSYADLARLTDEVAGGLAALAIGEGSVVGLLMQSTPDYVVAFGAIAKLGGITAGVNPRHTIRERHAVLSVLKPDLVLASPDLAEGADPGCPMKVFAPAASADALLAELQVRGFRPAPLTPDADRLVCICFTSGSTGEPKGALFANRQLEAIASLDTGGAWGGRGHNLNPTAMAHIGFMTKIPWMLAAGGEMHLQHRWEAGRTIELMGTHRIASISAIPPQMALMLRHPAIDDYEWTWVKGIVAGAAASPPALVAEAWAKFHAPYLIRYSSTESGGVGLGTSPDADDDEALNTIGRPRPGVEAEVRDASGQPVAAGDIGELWLRSPAQMVGFWRNPEATAEALVNGWLRTGDLARVDERGLFRLAGRAKEMFIRGGYNVYPMEVESVLGTHPKVAQIVVVPRPDAVMGEIGVAVVVPRDPADPPTVEDLRAHGKGSLSSYKLPEAIRLVAEIPLHVNSKIDRRALAEVERSG